MGLSCGEKATSEEPSEYTRIEELRRVQLERLRWSLRHAYDNVEHYRRSFSSCRIDPDALVTLEDLGKFPFLTKQDFRANYPFGLFAVPHAKVRRLHTSSGTSGKPTVVGYTAGDLDLWASLMSRCIRAAGARTGDIVHVAFDYGLFTGGLGAHAGAERLGCTVIPVSSGRSDWQVQLIEDFRPDILMATPSYALKLADAFERHGADPCESSLRIGIFGAEPWGETTRSALESRLGIEALDLYGLAEAIGPGVACERTGHRGTLTLWEDHFYPEIVDPKTGAVLPDGETGELVLTSLTKEAVPIIRYRTHDLTRLLPPMRGPLRRMTRVLARSDDMLVVHGVNVYPSQIEALIAHSGGLSSRYRLEITHHGALEQLTVHVEALQREHEGEAGRRRIAEVLAGQIKTFVGVSVTVLAHEPGTLERVADTDPPARTLARPAPR